MLAKRHAQHRYRQGQGEQGGDQQVPAIGVAARGGRQRGLRAVVDLHRAVARGFDRGRDLVRVHLARGLDIRGFRRQVDAGVDHARQFAQRLLDAPDAGGAGHAGHAEPEVGGRIGWRNRERGSGHGGVLGGCAGSLGVPIMGRSSAGGKVWP